MTGMARRSSALATISTQDDNILRFDSAPEFSVDHDEDPPMEDMDQQVKEAQQRLANLRVEQEELERQKQMLESLRQKQERFISGKKEIVDKLERSLRTLAGDLEEARRRVDNMTLTQQDYQERLTELKAFLPERWHRNQLDQELDRALTSLNEAEASYEKGVRRVHNPRSVETSSFHHISATEDSDDDNPAPQPSTFASSSGGDDLTVWMRRGFAFTLPLIATLLIVLILAKLMF